MLEEQTLLLRPGPGGDARRHVLSAATGAPLGFARRRPTPGPAWRRWFAAPVLAVHEAGDEPLLCTVQRFWWFGPFWEVRDADGHRVATVGRDAIADRWERPVAVRRRGPGGSVVWARPRDGAELAALVRGPDGVRLRFADDTAGQPFVRMALLAAALVRETAAAP